MNERLQSGSASVLVDGLDWAAADRRLRGGRDPVADVETALADSQKPPFIHLGATRPVSVPKAVTWPTWKDPQNSQSVMPRNKCPATALKCNQPNRHKLSDI